MLDDNCGGCQSSLHLVSNIYTTPSGKRIEWGEFKGNTGRVIAHMRMKCPTCGLYVYGDDGAEW